MRLKFTKKERLCSQKLINQLFVEGKGLYYFPFRLVYSLTEKKEENTPVQIVISVPKRNHKHAVKRNILKRRIREAYRKKKHRFYANLPLGCTINLMLIYVSSTISTYGEIESKLIPALDILVKRVEKDFNISIRPID
ncbi:MAG: ribonuclease P protein component [Prevotellaceae bacterium]|jgi:ribonuclease P protein component|nr:ribonuclease P protein component [Prevotellaceae bacterium]